MQSKKGANIILIFLLCFLLCSNVSAKFSFFSYKNFHESINVTINFQTSSAIRSGTTFQASVKIQNFNEHSSAMIKEIELLDENQDIVKIVKVNKNLKSLKNTFEERARLLEILQNENSCSCKKSCGRFRSKWEEVKQKIILKRLEKIDFEIDKEAFQETFALEINDFKEGIEAGDNVLVILNVEYKVRDKKYAENESSSILFSEPLPTPPHNSPGWYVGDQHMHSEYGTTFAEHPDPLIDMINESEISGLNWVIFTDHSVAFSDSAEWEEGRDACLKMSTSNFKCLYGQEMSVGDGSGLCDSLSNSHYLIHPLMNDDFEYVDGSCDAAECNDCRDEQTVINEVNDARGIGFLAHPYLPKDFPTDFAWKDWSVTGFSGMEIINSKIGDFNEDDELTINNPDGEKNSWTEFLDKETNPEDGFVVGVAGSDAHNITSVGHTFNYCYINSGTLTTKAIRSAYKNGNCVASTGPFLAFTLNGKIIGEIVKVNPGKINISIQAASTNEFGELKELDIYVGDHIGKKIFLSTNYYSNEVELDLNANDKYIRMVVYTKKDKVAITNPIWLDIDNSTSLFDFKNNLGEVVASFRQNGNLRLKGDCSYYTECAEDEGSMVFQNSNHETVAYLSQSGNLCLETDSCNNDHQAECNPPSDAFLVQDNSGNNLSYIDFNGNLCLTGDLGENAQ